MIDERKSDPAARAPVQAAAVVAGVAVTALAYPPHRLPGLGLVMLAPLAFLLDGVRPRRAFALAWVYSVGVGLVLARWLLHALVVEYRVAAAPAWLFTAIVIGGLALVPASAGAVYAALRPRLRAPLAALAFAAVWTLGEWVRGEVVGVPWILASQTVTRWPVALQVAELGGSYAISFAVLAIAGGVGIAAHRREPRALAAPAAVAALWLGYGALRLAAFPPDAGAGRPTARIGIVQASVPQSERFQPGSAARNVARHAEATRALAAQGPLDLIVWSETAVDIDIDRTPRLRAGLERLAREIGVPIVTGAPRSAHGRRTNSVVLVTPEDGLAESYDKQRLVPFSEYDPPGGALLARLIGPVVEGDPYVPGTVATVFRAGPIPFATPVCFEITYPDLVRRFRAAGARLLVNLSNDAWFGRVGYPQMHFDQAILRAVETRTPVVRGANTGISGVIDAAGRVGRTIPAFQEGTLVATVVAAGAPPLYVREGDAPLLAALAALLAVAGRRPHAAPRGARRGRAARRRRDG
jgi:apolipoprotein N-acyltransferase